MKGMDFVECMTIKSSTQYAAKNSLILSMAFLLLVALTHYVIMQHKNQKDYKDIKNAPEGAQKLFDLVREAHGGLPIFLIKPSDIDDTVAYVFGGKGMGKDLF
jgi:hypothetical protein